MAFDVIEHLKEVKAEAEKLTLKRLAEAKAAQEKEEVVKPKAPKKESK